MAAVDTAELVLTDKVQEPLTLSSQFRLGLQTRCFCSSGIEFIQIIKSGKAYPMSNGEYNAMAIVKVDQNVTTSTLQQEGTMQ